MAAVAVVGGGPAGLMAAEVLAAAGLGVTVYERMPSVGRKFLLAGRGGLNLTHSEPSARFWGRYGAEMRGVVEGFPPDAVRAWCEGLGEATFVGSSGRVFPRAMKASPLLRAWLRRLGAAGVAVRPGHRWTGWAEDGVSLRFETGGGPVTVESEVGGAATGQAITVAAGAVVLALGGASWPRLGSDGAWAPVLAGAGVAVTPLRPANAGFLCAWSAPMRRFAGAPLKRIGARFAGVAVRGEAVITSEGIEGGVVYALGAALREVIAARGEAVLELDLRPDLDEGALAVRLGGAGVSTSNALRRAGLSAAAAALVREAGLRGGGMGAGTGADNRPLAARVKGARLRLVGMQGLERAISTAGGVRFAELEGSMLRGRPGVFVAGEMLDWEAPTGGYLLTGCLASGRVAGLAAAAWVTARR